METKMIYATKERALEVAAMLNAQLGNPPAFAVLSEYGWIVSTTYRDPAIWGAVAN
jgi:hypothetical protein